MLKPSQQHLSKLLRLIELYIQAASRISRRRAILILRKSARITVKVTFSVAHHPFSTDLFAAKSDWHCTSCHGTTFLSFFFILSHLFLAERQQSCGFGAKYNVKVKVFLVTFDSWGCQRDLFLIIIMTIKEGLMYIPCVVCELGWAVWSGASLVNIPSSIPQDGPFSFLFSLSQTSNSCRLIVLTFPGN